MEGKETGDEGIPLQLSSIWTTTKKKESKKYKRNRAAFSTLSRQSLLIAEARLAENIERAASEREKEDHIHRALIALDSQLSSAIEYIHESNNTWLEERFKRLNSVSTPRALRFKFGDLERMMDENLREYDDDAEILKRVNNIDWTGKMLPRKSDVIKDTLVSLFDGKKEGSRKQKLLSLILIALNHFGLTHLVLKSCLGKFSKECRKIVIRVMRKHVLDSDLVNMYGAYKLANNEAAKLITSKSDGELITIVRKYLSRGMTLNVQAVRRRKSHGSTKGFNDVPSVDSMLYDATIGKDFAISLLCEYV